MSRVRITCDPEDMVSDIVLIDSETVEAWLHRIGSVDSLSYI